MEQAQAQARAQVQVQVRVRVLKMRTRPQPALQSANSHHSDVLCGCGGPCLGAGRGPQEVATTTVTTMPTMQEGPLP